MKHKKTRFLFIVIPILIVGTIIVAGFFPFSPPFLRTRMLQELKRAGLSDVEVASVSIRPWVGLSINGVDFTQTNDKGSLSLSIAEIQARYRLFKIISGGTQLKSRALAGPDNRGNRSHSGKGLDPLLDVLDDPVVIQMVRSIEVSGISLSMKAGSDSSVTINNGRIQLRSDKDAKATTIGTFSASSCRVLRKAYTILRPSTQLTISKGVLSLSKIKGSLCDGTIKGSARIDLRRMRLVDGDLNLVGAKIEKWYAAQPDPQGELSGKIDISFDANPSGFTMKELNGKGHATAKKVVIDPIPLQRNLILLLAMPQLSHIEFSSLSIDYSIHGGKVYTDSVHGTGIPLDLDAQGWIGFDGAISEKIACVLDKNFSRSLPPVVQKSLLEAPGHRLMFDCVLFGDMKDPKVSLNRKIVQRAVHNAFEEIGDQLQDFFK